MVCIYCMSKTKVSNSRPGKSRISSWRRRTCLNCHATFTTRETPEIENSFRVLYPNATLRPLLRDELFISIYRSLSHRKSALTDAAALTDTILRQVLPGLNGIVNIQEIISTSNEILSRFDKAAATFYSAHHNR